MNIDRFMDQVMAGDGLSSDDITALAAQPDPLSVGMLADAVRRRLHGTRVTYLRVAACQCDAPCADVPPAARELRITGVPGTLAVAVAAVERAKAAAGDRVVSGFSWSDVERLAGADGQPPGRTAAVLRNAGLEAFAEIPIDTVKEVRLAIDALRGAGFERLRLTIADAPGHERTRLVLEAAALQKAGGGIEAINPLPTVLQPSRPTTGYEDVRAVAIARLAAPGIPHIQVDWSRYGPKLAQVALTFGADDLDAVTAAEDAPDGRRRAPLEELRRNIEAAGFSAAERDGRFHVVS